MTALVPLHALAVLFLAFHVRASVGEGKPVWRDSLARALVAWGLAIFVSTEALGFFNGIRFAWMLGFWTLLLAGALAWLYAELRRGRRFHAPTPQGLERFDKAAIVCVVLVLLVCLVIALAAPPNNYDSMTYHMSRVAHWAQNGSVAHYPTNIHRQAPYHPFAEYMILHFYVLAGGDAFANLVQWLSLAFSSVLVSLIAARVGASARGQVLAAVLAVSIPVAIAEASSTQNDLVAGLWLVLAVCFFFKLRRRAGIASAFFFGASLALATITKGTAYTYALPFCIWIGVEMLIRLRVRAITRIAVICALALVVNAPYFARNFQTFGNPLGASVFKEDYRLANERFAPGVLFSNVIRNAALHTGTPLYSLNELQEKAIRKVHEAAGLDVNDHGTTFKGTTFRVRKPGTHEDNAQNPLHMALAVLAMAGVLFSRRLRTRGGLILGVLALSGFLLFCLTLKWQPWHSRMHLPAFILFTPVVGTVLTRLRAKWPSVAVVVVVLAASPYWLFCHWTRPVIDAGSPLYLAKYMVTPKVDEHFTEGSIFTVPREDQYFWAHAHNMLGMRRAAQFVEDGGYRNVGLFLREDDWEYPFWALIDGAGSAIRIEHVGVQNATGKIQLPGFEPDVIIAYSKADFRHFPKEYRYALDGAERFGNYLVMDLR